MLTLDSSYATDLDGEFSIPWEGAEVPAPRTLLLNRSLAEELGLDPDALASDAGARTLVGMSPPEGSRPVALAYAGHQFGGFSPRLGDGRALLLGEVVDAEGRLHDLHLKGSGATPFSRGGDGKAVLGPVLREYVMGEAMHALGVPTTRALAALTTGEMVLRQGGQKPGAVLARVAASHIRVGTFEYFSARRDVERLRALVDYAIGRHDPEAAGASDPALALLQAVRDRQARLVAGWMGVGFIHGVMNTDNTAISGETIDYGPCAFMEAYDPSTVFSSIDHHGRYAYGNQPSILQWNLARFAESLLPLIEAESREAAIETLTAEVNEFGARFAREWLAVMRAKLGLREAREGDAELVQNLLDVMQRVGADFTLGFRRLSAVLRGSVERAQEALGGGEDAAEWLERWRARLDGEGVEPRERAAEMDRVNPIYIPRNHRVEAALEAAEERLDLGPVRELLEVLERPFDERPGLEAYAEPAPEDFGPYVTFCGT